MNEVISKAIREGTAVLFLGAGASKGSESTNGADVPLGADLAIQLAEEFELTYDDDSIADVYSACLSKDRNATHDSLIARFRSCKPSTAYTTISTIAWRRIYTTNIDDAYERVNQRVRAQAVRTCGVRAKVEGFDPSYRTVDYAKLNGSINEINNGLIFSPSEYGQTAASGQLWYDELAKDFFNFTFIFIGTKLNESLFYHHIERYRSLGHDGGPGSFLITPGVTEIKRTAFKAAGITHIDATIQDLANWITREFPNGYSAESAFIGRNPQLQSRTGALTLAQPVMMGLEPVNRASIAQWIPSEASTRIRTFYQGFKPNWREIIDAVPAWLSAHEEFFLKLQKSRTDQLTVVEGSAGSGKTTLLMQMALAISDQWGCPCFFVGQELHDLKGAVSHLEKVLTTPYYLFTDQLDEYADTLNVLFESKRYPKLRVIGSERSQIWGSRVAARLAGHHAAPYRMHLITEDDALKILVKLEAHGPWTRLGKLKPIERHHEIFRKSKRQLLIGLMEATSGKGFDEIIESEYLSLPTATLRRVVLFVGLATVHRLPMTIDFLSSGLIKLKIKESPFQLIGLLQGIISRHDNLVVLRHPIYARRIFERYASQHEIGLTLTALLDSFASYQSPVVQHLPPPLNEVYRKNINHRFLTAIFKRTEKVIELYQRFEKEFEPDGLYWLHYGLALRDVGQQEQSLTMLRTARSAYPSEHTIHAYAQQLFIVAKTVENIAKAETLVIEAVEILRGLHKQRRRQQDFYPIVLLSEGHVTAIRNLRGDADARVLARQYGNEIESFKKQAVASDRVHATWEKLASYSTTGRWISFEENEENWFTEDAQFSKSSSFI